MKVAPSPQPSPARGEGVFLSDARASDESPQPSPSRREGVKSQQLADAEHFRLLDFEVAKKSTNTPADEMPPLPLWERVGERGC